MSLERLLKMKSKGEKVTRQPRGLGLLQFEKFIK